MDDEWFVWAGCRYTLHNTRDDALECARRLLSDGRPFQFIEGPEGIVSDAEVVAFLCRRMNE